MNALDTSSLVNTLGPSTPVNELDPSLVALLAREASTRLDAVDRVPPTTAGLHGLRGALVDEDARVRAAAARRLGLLGHREASAWLREALAQDPRPVVREAALVALARLGDRDALAPSDRAAREDPIWWVRRAGVLAAATLGGGSAARTLWAASEDPFWRVRHAASQALSLLGDADPSSRDFLLSFEGCRGPWAEGVRTLLATRWGRVLAPLPAAFSEPPEESPLVDPDPAVTTARLLDASEVDPRVLLRLLADPHEPLRRLATRRLLEAAPPEILDGALRWLDGRQPPHAADAACRLLARSGEALVAPLVQRVLRETISPGVYAWAASWAAGRRRDECTEALAARTKDPEARVRAASLRALTQLDPQAGALLVAALDDPDEGVQAAAASGLAWRRSTSPEAACVADLAGRPLPVRRALLELAVRHRDTTTLRRGLLDGDGLIRARSVAALATGGQLATDERREASLDADPWVRAAALDPQASLDALEQDPDAGVRRRALLCLRAAHPPLDRTSQQRAAVLAARSPDAWVRAHGAPLFTPEGGADALLALLSLSRDPSLAVRAAASDPLEAWPALAPALRALLASGREISDEERAAALTWLARGGDEADLARLVDEALASAGERPASAIVARGLVVLREPAASENGQHERTVTDSPSPVTDGPTGSPRPARLVPRLLGQTGIAVSAMAISGAYEPSRAALEQARDAGVTTFFWEPRHANLTRFLRTAPRAGERRVIVAGSYHADAPSIERDLALALRRLRTEVIDVFLLFWARSPERLSPRAFDLMTELKRSGKVRAIGFSTHDRALAGRALEAHPWDALMIRHSAAHPGAERELLPLAQRRGTGVISFNALCYGQLLRAPVGHPHEEPLSAADCYRYSLSQPGVSLCLSAPRRASEMAENLRAAADPQLAPDALVQARRHGARVHAQSRLFNALVRRPGNEAPARALLDLLASTEGESEAFVEGSRPALEALATRPRRPGRRWSRAWQAAGSSGEVAP